MTDPPFGGDRYRRYRRLFTLEQSADSTYTFHDSTWQENNDNHEQETQGQVSAVSNKLTGEYYNKILQAMGHE